MPGVIRANSSEVAVESLTLTRTPAPDTADRFSLSFEHTGLQAPTEADDQMKVSRFKAVVVLIGANDYGFADTSSSRSRE